jgi:hypothetical protein
MIQDIKLQAQQVLDKLAAGGVPDPWNQLVTEYGNYCAAMCFNFGIATIITFVITSLLWATCVKLAGKGGYNDEAGLCGLFGFITSIITIALFVLFVNYNIAAASPTLDLIKILSR